MCTCHRPVEDGGRDGAPLTVGLSWLLFERCVTRALSEATPSPQISFLPRLWLLDRDDSKYLQPSCLSWDWLMCLHASWTSPFELLKSTSNAAPWPVVDSCLHLPRSCHQLFPFQFLFSENSTWCTKLSCEKRERHALTPLSSNPAPSPSDATSGIYLNWSTSLSSHSNPPPQSSGSPPAVTFHSFLCTPSWSSISWIHFPHSSPSDLWKTHIWCHSFL